MQQTCVPSRYRRGHGSCWSCAPGRRSEKTHGHLKQIYLGKQSIKGFHYSILQRGHSLSLYNGILIHMHLLWQGTKSIVWQACSLLPGINNSLRNTLGIDLLFKRLLSVAALCWSADSVIVAPKTQQIIVGAVHLGMALCGKIELIALHINVLYL